MGCSFQTIHVGSIFTMLMAVVHVHFVVKQSNKNLGDSTGVFLRSHGDVW